MLCDNCKEPLERTGRKAFVEVGQYIEAEDHFEAELNASELQCPECKKYTYIEV